MRQEASTRQVAARAVNFNIIMIEDVIVEACKETDLVIAVGFTVFAITEIGIMEGYDPFEAIP